jgi:hypothetical protein
MIIGLSVQNFTILHVVITLIAIVSGFIVMFGMFGSKRLSVWTAIFWLTTILTSVTGFMFPYHGFTPAIGTGIVAMIVLAIGLLAIYVKHFAGAWRWIYAVAAVISLYLNVFVLITQSFLKLTFLNPAAPQLAPNFAAPTSTYFAVAQGGTLLFFIAMGIAAAIKFRPIPA